MANGWSTKGQAEVIEVIEKMSKKNKPYKLIVLGNKETYWKAEFFLSDDCALGGLVLGKKVEVTLEHVVRGYDVSATVVAVKNIA